MIKVHACTMHYDHSTRMHYDHSTRMYCDHGTCIYGTFYATMEHLLYGPLKLLDESQIVKRPIKVMSERPVERFSEHLGGRIEIEQLSDVAT